MSIMCFSKKIHKRGKFGPLRNPDGNIVVPAGEWAWSHLELLHDLEKGKITKIAHKLDHNTVNPAGILKYVY